MISTPTTFKQIFAKQLENGSTINAIEVPIIQRDYAQGRKTKEVTRIRNRFIQSIHTTLTDDSSAPMKLDFVYGNVEDGKLIPLDGQQRLTTLFLLHWYIAKAENVPFEEYAFLNNFTYKTRFSSQHFCEKLVQCEPNFNFEKVSTWIIDQNWFMYSWDKDPTIQAMLIMIDKIQATFKGHTRLWLKLINNENPLISFYFLPLEEMGLTDKLYIKMNSRGKPLTPFEHFKADFEKTIKQVSEKLHSEFINKVDNDWVDMLWKYRGEDNEIDDEFMKFYRFTTEMICFEQGIEILENDFELSKSVYGIDNTRAKENLSNLFKTFDTWLAVGNISEFFHSIFGTHAHQTGKVLLFNDSINLFSLCCNHYGEIHANRRNFTLNNTLLLYAVQQYLLNKGEISVQQFQERIRIVRNLVYNSNDEIRESRLQALLSDTANIIIHGSIETRNSGYSELQKNQEKEKVEWRNIHPQHRASLNLLEDQKLLQGNTAIIKINECPDFEMMVNNFISLFNSPISFITISRAMLTIGDYSQRASWRFLLGNTNDSSWRELFTPSNKRKLFENTQDVIFELLNHKTDSMEDRVNSLVETYLSESHRLLNWKHYLIKYPLMREGRSGVYYWLFDPERTKDNQYQFYMMNTPHSLNGRHWNPFLFVIFHLEQYHSKLALDEYGALLNVLPLNQKIECKNSHWAIYNENDELVDKVMIKQENNIDLEDRIEVLIDYLDSKI